MKTLNDRYDYGLDLFLLSIDEGITGYRDDSLEVSRTRTSSPSFLLPSFRAELTRAFAGVGVYLQTVKRNQVQYDLPLKILSYDELYGWTMDRIVETVGRKNNCELQLRSSVLLWFLLALASSFPEGGTLGLVGGLYCSLSFRSFFVGDFVDELLPRLVLN